MASLPPVSGYSNASSVPESKPIQALSSFKCHVLVVDDEDMTHLIFRQILTKLQFAGEVAIAKDGEEAVKVYRESLHKRTLEGEIKDPIQLIFMDIDMPKMDGLEATRTIRKMEEEGKLYIICIGSDAIARKEECLSAGMEDCLIPKPLSTENILSVFRKFQELAASQS
jgi:osomolarity two-component system sensor histidine kinase SLN1